MLYFIWDFFIVDKMKCFDDDFNYDRNNLVKKVIGQGIGKIIKYYRK